VITLPFPTEMPFCESVKNKYLMSGLKWIGDFRDPDSNQLLSVKTGSMWGLGYGLLCLAKAKTLFLNDGSFPGIFDEKAENAIRLLCNKILQGENTCCWENNIWDTAVICRALSESERNYPRLGKQLNLFLIIEKSLRWLADQVVKWKILRYVQGIPDISQILRTFILARMYFPELVNKIDKEKKADLESGTIINELLDEIMHSLEKKSELYNGHAEDIITWDDDVFSTADAVIGLSKVISSPNLVSEEKLGQIKEILKPAIRYLELEQIDGRWGIEETTSMALRAYLLGCNALGVSMQPEPHIIFKAVRYLCDSKIFFADGSVAHEMEPTIYLLLALIDVIEVWKLPDGLCDRRPVIELYDYVIWNTPTRSTHERTLRFQAQTEADLLRRNQEHLECSLLRSRKKERLWQTFLFLFIWILIGLLSAYFLGIGENREMQIRFIGQIFAIKDWQALFAFLTLVGGISWFIFDRILRWSSPISQNSR